MKVKDIGEFGLIQRIQQILPKSYPMDVIEGIGDDTAIIKLDDNRVLLATCDIQIENTHFRLKNTSYFHLGKRAMAVNLSDIASMGGRPTYALVSLGLPSELPVEHFDDLLCIFL